MTEDLKSPKLGASNSLRRRLPLWLVIYLKTDLASLTPPNWGVGYPLSEQFGNHIREKCSYRSYQEYGVK